MDFSSVITFVALFCQNEVKLFLIFYLMREVYKKTHTVYTRFFLETTTKQQCIGNETYASSLSIFSLNLHPPKTQMKQITLITLKKKGGKEQANIPVSTTLKTRSKQN